MSNLKPSFHFIDVLEVTPRHYITLLAFTITIERTITEDTKLFSKVQNIFKLHKLKKSHNHKTINIR